MAAVAASSAGAPASLRAFLQRPAVAIGLVLLIIVVALAVFAPFVTPFSPTKLSIASRLKPPSAEHWFGTDDFGRDIFARTLYAGRLSLTVGASVVLVSGVIGLVLGVAAGYFRRLDPAISRLLDAMMAFPDILLAISLVAALGASVVNVIAALGITYAPRLARIVRASTLVTRELTFIEAAHALGVGTFAILTRHILRSLVSPILVQGTFVFAYAMLAEAGLSFLGVGVSPDVPTWGTMISLGREFMNTAPWLMLFPGIAIVLTVLSLQLVGDGLRDLLDPRLSQNV
ncbi:ABC transporter permease [Consotaella salsifontis]|uniref:Peptide/nickel transport system permease protein n=1 Tax=Consotaella salsifontis TaxID=1365950 RepID=A0A1T4PQ09_9HYPH|nr:ABC transporter permease [Consotaella salsifontis]SJZ93317.1 peptide/nickel transport system permease protein [Consotaella salsifontis]